MPIDFNKDRWAQVRENYTNWWNNDLDRPIVALTMFDEYPDGSSPTHLIYPNNAVRIFHTHRTN